MEVYQHTVIEDDRTPKSPDSVRRPILPTSFLEAETHVCPSQAHFDLKSIRSPTVSLKSPTDAEFP